MEKRVSLYNQTITGRKADIHLHAADLKEDTVTFLGNTGGKEFVTVKGCQNEGLIVEVQALRAKLVATGVL